MKPKTFSLVVTVLALLALSLTSGSKAIAQGPGWQEAEPQSANGPAGVQALQASLGTGFTYQGQLKQDGNPVNGACDFYFNLYTALTAGLQIGSTQTVLNVQVSGGNFTVGNLDFGSNAFNGEQRWLEIGVRCPAGSLAWTSLSPRQELTAVPYALALPGLWTQPNATSPNIIGGYHANAVTSGVVGATISGGGTSSNNNRVTDDYGTVGGGSNNRAGNNAGSLSDHAYATVGGGQNNTASSHYTTIGGGKSNVAGGVYATVSGGISNTVSGGYSVVGGGILNTASGSVATVPGGEANSAAGRYSFAAGFRAKANHNGAFVWGDSTAQDFASTGNNQFLIRANGGVGVNTNSPANNGLQVAKDFSSSGGYGQIEATGATSPAKRLTLGFDTTNNLGWIQASETGVAYRNLALNPAGGNVGVGTTYPMARLDVRNPNGLAIQAQGYGAYAGIWALSDTGIAGNFSTDSDPTHPQIRLSENGNDYARLNFTNSSGSTRYWTIAGYLTTTVAHDRLNFYNSSTGDLMSITGDGKVGIGTINPAAKLDVAGTMASNVVQIRGGSDLAERFDVEGNIVVEPGTLMVIDDEHPGKLEPSRQAYDTKVAGVASGAGGVQPGLTLHQAGVMDGNTLVAIAGRVYVKAEALSAPIRPGDLLTSSNVPGYAMKAADRGRAQGAIIGKAMSELDEGTGLVLVLVNLQ